MAQRTITTLIDDIDGGEATETVTFGLDGKTYEIDLNEKNAAGLRKAFDLYVSAGRKTRSTRRSTSPGGPSVDTKAVRAWAASNGIEVSSRGRIPSDVLEKYRAAGN